jgi:hypothetical protein
LNSPGSEPTKLLPLKKLPVYNLLSIYSAPSF